MLLCNHLRCRLNATLRVFQFTSPLLPRTDADPHQGKQRQAIAGPHVKAVFTHVCHSFSYASRSLNLLRSNSS